MVLFPFPDLTIQNPVTCGECDAVQCDAFYELPTCINRYELNTCKALALERDGCKFHSFILFSIIADVNKNIFFYRRHSFVTLSNRSVFQ
jgi:hypothetical protein